MTNADSSLGDATQEDIPQGLKPLFLAGLERAKPEGLAYLEATEPGPEALGYLGDSGLKPWLPGSEDEAEALGTPKNIDPKTALRTE